MTRTSARPGLLGLLLLVIALPGVLLVPAAHAEVVVEEDAVGDAEAWTYFEEFQFVPAPEEASVDITRTVASFGDRRLHVAAEFRDLEVRPRHDTLVRIRTPRRTFDVIAARRLASRATIELTNPRDGDFACRGLRVSYDGAADTVSISVPTRCIGSPPWVRLGVKATASPTADPDPQAMVVFFADDARRDADTGSTIGMGPRIHRG